MFRPNTQELKIPALHQSEFSLMWDTKTFPFYAYTWLRRPGHGLCVTPPQRLSLPPWSLCLIKSQRRQKGSWALNSSINNILYVMDIPHKDVHECWGEPMRTPKLGSAWTREKKTITFCIFLPLTYFFVVYPIRNDINWEFFFGISPLCLLPD